MEEARTVEIKEENKKKLVDAVTDLMKVIREVTISEAERHGVRDYRILLLFHQFTEKAIVALLKGSEAFLQGVVDGLKQKESVGG